MPSRRRKTLLPAGFADFLRRRLLHLLGLLLVAGAAALVVALISYDPSDPSLNTARGAGRINNWLGRPGAVIADLVLQTLGLSATLFVLVFAAWGLRLLGHGTLARPWLRIASLVLALLGGSLAFAATPAPEAWPLNPGLGGTVGALILTWVTSLSGGSGAFSNPLVIAVVAGAGSGFVTFWTMGFSLSEWHSAVKRAARLIPSGDDARRRARTWRLRLPRFGREGADDRADRQTAGHGEENAREWEMPQARPPASRSRLSQPKKAATPAKASQSSLNLGTPGGEFQIPPLDLLEPVPETEARAKIMSPEALEQNARLLEQVLEDFGIRGEIVRVRPGPVVTLYELEPAPGIKTSRIIGLSDDIARSMSAVSARIATIPGRSVIGIELPNSSRQTVFLRELMASRAYEQTSAKLPLALGKDISGSPVVVDLARMPHLLVAGTTGSGKSVGINAMILSLLFRMPPDACRLIMIDPKMLELSTYDGIPHLMSPVVTEPKKAVVALKWTVREMEERYRAMSKLGVRNIEGYNARLRDARKKGEVLMRKVQTGFDSESGRPVYEDQPLDLTPLPYIIVVVDEMADLMLVSGKDIEAAIQRLSQMARAAGIHIIMATQRPSVDVVTGTIKANFPTRVSFQVTSKIDSRTILGEQGAEQLLGQGDMLYMAGGGRITRIHGPFVDDQEVEAVATYLRTQGEPTYVEGITEEEEEAGLDGLGAENGGDELYQRAVELVVREGRASTSFIQRHLQIGYNRAARIIEQMEKQGVVSPANHVGKREVLAGGR